MTLAKAIAEAIAGGIAGYASTETGQDFLGPLLAGQQQAQERKARKAEKKEEREFRTEEREAGQEFQKGLVKGQQTFQTGEREAGQEFQKGLVKGQQTFQTGERESGQTFQAGERESGQTFRAGERESGQTFQAGERESGQTFRAGEREAGQTFRAGEREAGQTFQAGERESGQTFQTGERESGQTFQTGLVGKQQTFQTGEREAGQTFQTGLVGKQQTFQTGEREAGQTFQTGERKASEQARADAAQKLQTFTAEQAQAQAQRDALKTAYQETGNPKFFDQWFTSTLDQAKADGAPPIAALIGAMSEGAGFVTERRRKQSNDIVDQALKTMGLATQGFGNSVKTVPPARTGDLQRGAQTNIDNAHRIAIEQIPEGDEASIAQLNQAYFTASAELDSSRQAAIDVGLKVSIVDQGQFEILADPNVPTDQLARVLQPEYGDKSTQQQVYNQVTELHGLLGTLSEVSRNDIADPNLASVLEILEPKDSDVGVPSKLISNLLRNRDSAPRLLRGIDSLKSEHIVNAKNSAQRLQRSKDLENSLAAANKSLGISVDPSFFNQSSDGSFTLSPDKFEVLVGEIKRAAPDNTQAQLDIIEDFEIQSGVRLEAIAKRIGLDNPGAGEFELDGSQSLAQHDDRKVDLLFRGDEATRGFAQASTAAQGYLGSRPRLRIDESFIRQVRRMPDRDAKEFLVSQNYSASLLDIIREGPRVLGDNLVDSLLPDDQDLNVRITEITEDKAIAAEYGDTARVAEIDRELATYQTHLTDPATVSLAQATSKDILRRVARNDLEGLVESLTDGLAAPNLFDVGSGDVNPDKLKELQEIYDRAPTQGSKVQAVISWGVHNDLFTRGTRGDMSQKDTQNLNNYFAEFGDSLGQRLDEYLAVTDFQLTMKDTSGMFSGKTFLDASPSEITMLFITADSEEMLKFLDQTNPDEYKGFTERRD
jgi:hypothetical protein